MVDEATKRKRAEDGALAMREHLAEQKRVDERTAKLRALRLAQEAKVPVKKSARTRKAGKAIPVEELNAANDK